MVRKSPSSCDSQVPKEGDGRWKTIRRISLIFFTWFLWEFAGFRLLWEKINPPPNNETRRPPSSFLFWLVSLYVALFTITSQIYIGHVTRVDNDTNQLIAMLGTTKKEAIAKLVIIQRRLVPSKPRFLRPQSVLKSLWSKDEYVANKIQIIRAIEINKMFLDSLDMRRARLRYAQLSKGSLKATKLNWADLEHANLRNANMEHADLEGATLSFTDLRGAHITIADLCRCKTLNGAQMDFDMKKGIEEKCPELLKQ